MTHATAEREPSTREQEAKDEEARKLAEAAAAAAAERAADEARFDAMFGGEDEQRRRAARTLSEQRAFDAADLGRRERFEAMTHEERETYLSAQEKLTPAERYAPDPQLSPEQQHSEDLAQELLLVYMEKRPLPDKLAMELIGLVKAHNLPDNPPVARTAAERQAIRDEADAEKRAARAR
jgi:hypothetical protein